MTCSNSLGFPVFRIPLKANLDPDPSCDLPADPDPTFDFNGYPDPDPAPYKLMRICDHWSTTLEDSILRLGSS
jgi:hypothetical protein